MGPKPRSLPRSRIATSGHKRSTTSRICVVITMVTPRATSAARMRLIVRLVTGSMPSKGSSSSTTRGACTSAAASASFFFMPKLYSATSARLGGARSSASNSSFSRDVMLASSSPYMRPTKRRYSGPVSVSNRPISSGITPIVRLTPIGSATTSRPSTVMRPELGRSSPVIIFSVVDLPAPLRPSSPRNAPGASVSES